jgi:hypothetical protein
VKPISGLAGAADLDVAEIEIVVAHAEHQVAGKGVLDARTDGVADLESVELGRRRAVEDDVGLGGLAAHARYRGAGPAEQQELVDGVAHAQRQRGHPFGVVAVGLGGRKDQHARRLRIGDADRQVAERQTHLDAAEEIAPLLVVAGMQAAHDAAAGHREVAGLQERREQAADAAGLAVRPVAVAPGGAYVGAEIETGEIVCLGT